MAVGEIPAGIRHTRRRSARQEGGAACPKRWLRLVLVRHVLIGNMHGVDSPRRSSPVYAPFCTGVDAAVLAGRTSNASAVPAWGTKIQTLRRPYGRGRGRAAVQVPRRSHQAGSADRFHRTGLAGGTGRGPKAPHEGGAGARKTPGVARWRVRVRLPPYSGGNRGAATSAAPASRSRPSLMSGSIRRRTRRLPAAGGDGAAAPRKMRGTCRWSPPEPAGARRAAADRAKRPPGTIRRRARRAGGGEPAGHICRDVPACGGGRRRRARRICDRPRPAGAHKRRPGVARAARRAADARGPRRRVAPPTRPRGCS